MKEQFLPQHIAIIMDGNRRWAKQKKISVNSGHKEGAKTLEKIVRYANQIGLAYITVYAFSTENWKRSEEEISALMLLLENYLNDYAKKADTENIKIKVLGDTTILAPGLQKSIKNAVERTKNNTGTVFSIALNYGGRAEILKAVKEIAQEVKEGKTDIENITEETIKNHLYTKDIPDPDFIIRTSNEMRLSNFLTWQSVYTEFLFLEKYWPDFTENDLEEAITVYKKRNRKFGAN